MENLTLHKMLNIWQKKIGLRAIKYTEGGVNRDDYITSDLLELYKLPLNKVYLMVQNVGGKNEYRIVKVTGNYKRFITFESTPIPRGGYKPKEYKTSYNTSMLKIDLIRPDGVISEDGMLNEVRSSILCFMPDANELRSLCQST